MQTQPKPSVGPSYCCSEFQIESTSTTVTTTRMTTTSSSPFALNPLDVCHTDTISPENESYHNEDPVMFVIPLESLRSIKCEDNKVQFEINKPYNEDNNKDNNSNEHSSTANSFDFSHQKNEGGLLDPWLPSNSLKDTQECDYMKKCKLSLLKANAMRAETRMKDCISMVDNYFGQFEFTNVSPVNNTDVTSTTDTFTAPFTSANTVGVVINDDLNPKTNTNTHIDCDTSQCIDSTDETELEFDLDLSYPSSRNRHLSSIYSTNQKSTAIKETTQLGTTQLYRDIENLTDFEIEAVECLLSLKTEDQGNTNPTIDKNPNNISSKNQIKPRRKNKSISTPFPNSPPYATKPSSPFSSYSPSSRRSSSVIKFSWNPKIKVNHPRFNTTPRNNSEDVLRSQRMQTRSRTFRKLNEFAPDMSFKTTNRNRNNNINNINNSNNFNLECKFGGGAENPVKFTPQGYSSRFIQPS